MTGVVLAEAGLSECARDAACSADFDRSVYELLAKLALVGVIGVWLAVTIAATFSIGFAGLTAREALRWVLIVWLVPFIGPVMWWRRLRRLNRRLPPLPFETESAPADRYYPPPPPR